MTWREAIKKHMTDDSLGNEIIMMRYDDKKLKYVYLCPICDTTWKN